MKRSAAVVGYECLFDSPVDEWHLSPSVIGRIAKMMETEGIVFDRERLSILLHETLEKRKKRAMETMVETNLSDIAASVLADLEINDPSMERRILDTVSEHYITHSKAKQGAVGLLQRLKKDAKVGLLCNVPLGIPHSIIYSQVREEGMMELLDDMQFSTEMGMRRPHARQFRFSLSNLNADPAECAAITSIAGDMDTLKRLSFGDILVVGTEADGHGKSAGTIDELYSLL